MAFDCNGHKLPDKFRHKDDVAQDECDARQRRRARTWTQGICEPHRVYDALSGEAGYDHNAYRVATNPIVYNQRTGFWEHAVTQDQVTQRVTQQYKLVKADTQRRVAAPSERHARNFHKSGNS